MNIFMNCDRESVRACLPHDDVIVIGRRFVVRDRKLIRAIWRVLLRGVKRHDPQPGRVLNRMRYGLGEEAVHLLEIPDGFACGSLAGCRVQVKVRRDHPAPMRLGR
jgi:hypothetical protein